MERGCGPGAVRGGTFERCVARVRARCGSRWHFRAVWSADAARGGNLVRFGARGGTFVRYLPQKSHKFATSRAAAHGIATSRDRALKLATSLAPRPRSTAAPSPAAPQPGGTTGPQHRGRSPAARRHHRTAAPRPRNPATTRHRSTVAPKPRNPDAAPRGRTRGQEMPGSAGMSPLTWEDTTVFKARERAPHAVHDFVPCTPDLPGSCVRISAIDSWAR